MLRTWTLATFALALAPPALALEETEKVVAEVVELSGVGDLADSFPALIDQQLSTQIGQLEGEDGLLFRRAFNAAFDPARIRASIVAALRATYDDAKAQAALHWYRSELGARIRDQEARVQTPEGQQAMVAFAQGLEASRPAPERVELAQRLDAASRSSAITLKLILELTRDMIMGMAALAPPDQERPTPEAIDELLQPQMGQLAPMIQTQTLVMILFSTRELGVDEIRSYLVFIESPAGQWVHEQTGIGLERAMARSGRIVVDHIATWAQKKRFADTTGAGSLREAATSDGRGFGRGTTQVGCIDAALERRHACRELVCFAQARIFLAACLETSVVEDTLCSDVPSSDDLASSVYWRLERCEERGSSTSACNDLMGTIQDYCSSRAHL